MSDFYETVPIADLQPLIAYHYTDMASGVMDYYLREAVIKFSRKTRILRRKIQIDIQKGVNDYLLFLEDGYLISEINQVRVDGVCLKKLCDSCVCRPMQFKYRSGQLTVCELEGCLLEVEVVAIPTRNSCEIDADIFNQFGDVIASGANSILMTGSDKRWKNLGLANQERLAFETGVEEAQLMVNRGFITPKVIHVKTASDFTKHYTIAG